MHHGFLHTVTEVRFSTLCDRGFFAATKNNYYNWYRTYQINKEDENISVPSLYLCCKYFAKACHEIKKESIIKFWEKSTLMPSETDIDIIDLVPVAPIQIEQSPALETTDSEVIIGIGSIRLEPSHSQTELETYNLDLLFDSSAVEADDDTILPVSIIILSYRMLSVSTSCLYL